MFIKALKRQTRTECGQALIEYALIIAVVVIIVFLLSFVGFATEVLKIYQSILAKIGAL